MREVKDHVVEGDSINHQIGIRVTDEPGAGGANHRYELDNIDFAKNSSSAHRNEGLNVILFQNGTVKEAGVNGVTQEALLAITIDRLRSFQAGPFSCRENAIALTHCEDALMWLQRRTRARLARGVEGTHTA